MASLKYSKFVKCAVTFATLIYKSYWGENSYVYTVAKTCQDHFSRKNHEVCSKELQFTIETTNVYIATTTVYIEPTDAYIENVD